MLVLLSGGAMQEALRVEGDEFHKVHTSPPWILRESTKHPGQFNYLNIRSGDSIIAPSPSRNARQPPSPLGPASGQASGQVMGFAAMAGSGAASSSSSVLQVVRVGATGSTGPMRPFGRPRTTTVGAAPTNNVSIHQLTAEGGDGNGRDEIDCLFDAIRSVALPPMLQEATHAERIHS